MKNVKKMGFGFGAMILRSGKVLLGLRNEDRRRASSLLHGEGSWTMPGGKVDFGESYIEAVKREVREETSLKVNSAKLISINNTVGRNAHFLTLGFKITSFSGSLKVMEPEEIIEWKWFDLKKLPQNLYVPSRIIIEKYGKRKLFDIGEKVICM
ncbi:MAG: NUDIX domain-containing protein [Candidatus Dojkabacteria bacterium]|nr:NUDIX domain-containing protein [Candidatus Dojkabacteria bacterium]